jgi:hypothetical protein
LSRFIRQPSQSIGLILIKLLPFQVLGIRPAKFAFIPGLESSLPKLVSRKTDIIHSCSFDFNLYLDSIDSGKLDNGLNADKEQFIVFLDEFLPFHPDYLSANVASPCAPELYYPALVSFFEAIESKLGCEVVVAAHPRSSYEHRPDYFGGRKIFFGKTHQLVKQSKGVITHGSTSVSFAVIYKKPIFFTSLEVIRQYRGYPLHAFYESMAQSLGKKLIILDQPLDVDWQSEIIVDLDAYGRYLDLYVKSPLAPERNSWQIFADYVLENL